MSRRDCLAWLARAGALTLAAGASHCFADDESGSSLAKIPDLKDIKNTMAYAIDTPNVIVSRTTDGLACLSRVCTHKGGKVQVDKAGAIFCPRHHATFDLTGKPTGGPAHVALAWYRTDIDKDGKISVDVTKTVKQGQWTALPEAKK